MDEKLRQEYSRLSEAVDTAADAGEDVGPANEALGAFCAEHGFGGGQVDSPDDEPDDAPAPAMAKGVNIETLLTAYADARIAGNESLAEQLADLISDPDAAAKLSEQLGLQDNE